MLKSPANVFAVCLLIAAETTILLAQTVSRLDTVYTPTGYQDGSLIATIFVPSPSSAKGIGVVLGRYTSATRLTAQAWCDTLAARGYLAMTIDYGNLDTSVYPKPQRAFKTAVEFLRRNAARFGIMKGRIVGFGQSQGSLIWGQTVIWDNDDAFFGTDPAVDDHLDAAVLLYGGYDMFNYLLPIQNTILTSHFSPNPSLRGTKGQCVSNTANITTPILLIHGSGDQVVNVIHSRMLRDSLQAHGKSVKLVELSGASHVFDIPNGPFTSFGLIAKDTVLAWLERTVVTLGASPEVSIPQTTALQQNYPNPFNPATVIRYQVTASGPVRLAVYDILGREVAVLADGKMTPGAYEATFNAAGLASGTYVYRLTAGSFVQSRRMLLLR